MKTKLPIEILFTFTFFLFTCATLAEIRFVSKTGSSVPPYTTWATASDSIQKCIDFSVAGDTIYVANGVYKEIIIIENKFLTLIGAGWDSCIVDTRDMATPTAFQTLYINGGTNIEGFYIKVSNTNVGTAIVAEYFSSDAVIKKNKIVGAKFGIDIFNSHLTFKNNLIEDVEIGVNLEAFDENYFPIIDSNIIITYSNLNLSHGISGSFGTSPTIRNNYIIGMDGGGGLSLILNPKEVVNNIFEKKVNKGLYGNYFSLGKGIISNNFIIGSSSESGFHMLRGSNRIVNNNIMRSQKGYEYELADTIKFYYNNIWDVDVPYTGFTPDSTNLTADPMLVSEDSSDFRLQMFSLLIDRGDPSILDPDGSRSDIGAYGGPLGESYKYLDLSPKAPRGIEAFSDSNLITLKWRKNTEADFSYYKLFRDTAANFTADTTTLVGIFTDTLYVQQAPSNVKKLFFKLTAVDSQRNESLLSEEIGVVIVSANDKWEIIDDYRLYPNFPNPFNPSTIIPFRLSQRAYVKLAVYDIKGELIEYLINEEMERGYYETNFTTRNLPSGVYLYKIDIISSETRIPLFSEMRKMVFIK